MNPLRRRIIEKAKAAREGRRMHAFYRGFQARRGGLVGNPHPPGGELHACWKAGWEFAQDDTPPAPPVCRFGPGGDFVRDWPDSADGQDVPSGGPR